MSQSSPLAAARRNSELGLVVMAAGISAVAFVLASLGKNSTMPATLVPFLIALLGMLIAAHIATRLLARGADGTLLPLAVMLHGIGYVMIARLSERRAALQTTWSFIAIVAFVLTLLIVQRPPDLARYKWTFLFVGAGLLMLPLVPGIGSSVGGAKIWVSIGPVNFQPGEFAKIALALFFAAYLADNRELISAGTRRFGFIRIPELRYVLPITLAWAFAVAVMVAEKDLGSALLFFTLFTVMMWVATERAIYLVLGLVIFSGAAYIAWRMFEVVQTRVDIWLDPWSQYEGKGYQPAQAMFAFANGGTAGTGLGLGNPSKIPAASTDYVFAAIGEEMGLIGATAVIIAFLLLLGAGLRVAVRADRPFEKLLATGLTTIISMQAFIIIGGVLRLVPLTGITLPFVSYGGSSLLANYILLALLLRISDSGARRRGETPDELTISERMEARRLRRAERKAARVNKQIRKLAAGLLVLYLALFAALNVVQVGKKQELDAHPQNNRQTIRDFNRMRGPIVTADGVVVARSVPVVDPDSQYRFQREYPTGNLFSNITGYYTYSFGSTQLEKTQNDVLMGDTTQQKVDSVFGGADNTGSVQLTLRADVQQVAAQAIDDFNAAQLANGATETVQGSVVVMDPRTGAVLAMVSLPRFDANQVADHDTKAAEDVLDFLNNYPGKPLLANAYQENYMPGSAFKVVTTGIAMENGVTSLDRNWPSETEWVPPQTNDPIQNYGGKACGGTMTEVFYRSCNIPFAQLASELGPQRMTDGVRAWGIGEKLPIDLPGAVASSFCGNVTPCDAAFFNDQLPLLAIGGFGQGNDLMVPLHMCMVAATVANGGVMMKPHVVDATLDHDGAVLTRTSPEAWKTPISPTTATILSDLMVGVVNNGTGKPMQLANGVQAAAKTGTAQLNFVEGEPQRSHAWIIGFAPAEAPRYAVSVVIKGTTDEISAGTGGRLAGPIAKQVLDYLFASES